MGKADRRSGRDAALTRLFEEQYDPLRRLAFLLLGDAGQAEEVVMDVFARALGRWSSFRDVEGPVPYLRRSVINACRSRGRRKSIEQRFVRRFTRRNEIDDAPPVELRGEALDVWAAVRALPERQRTSIVLRYVEDLSEAEIAQAMDAPVGTVKSLLSRARTRLSKSLDMDLEVRVDER